jgi:hypothetical protein
VPHSVPEDNLGSSGETDKWRETLDGGESSQRNVRRKTEKEMEG